MEWERDWREPDEEKIQELHEQSEKDEVPLTPERQESHKSPEKVPEKEPGGPFRPGTPPEKKDSERTDASEVGKVSKDDIPSDWEPSPETIRAISGKEGIKKEAERPEEPSLTDRMVERMERKGKIDLTKPGAWGRFAHDAIEERVQEKADPNEKVKVEKTVGVIKEGGTEGKGRYDVLSSKYGLLEIKTHNLDAMSNGKLARFLKETASQVEKYQWSRDIEGKPPTAVFFEFPPEDEARREVIESFFRQRDIRVIWGED